jgi:hypothetical protein
MAAFAITFRRRPQGQKNRTKPSDFLGLSSGCFSKELIRTRILDPHRWHKTLTVSAPGAGSNSTSFPHLHLTFDIFDLNP